MNKRQQAELKKLLAQRKELIEIVDTLAMTIKTALDRGDHELAKKLRESRRSFMLQLLELEVQLIILKRQP